MAKISAQKFLEGLMSLGLGVKQGQQQGQQLALQRQDQEQQRMLQLLPQLARMEEQRRSAQLEPLLAATRDQSLTPEARTRVYGELPKLFNQPSGVEGLIGKAMLPGGLKQDDVTGFLGGMNAPQAPGASPQGFQFGPNDFRNRDEETARGQVGEQLESAVNAALAQGDTETAQRLRGISTGFALRQVPLDVATKAIQEAYGGFRAKDAGKLVSGQVKDAAEWIDKTLKDGSIPEAHVGAASALSGRLAALDATTPEGAKAAAALLQEYAKFRQATPLQPTGTQRQGVETAKRLTGEGYTSTNTQLLARIQNAKTPGALVNAIDQQRQFAATTGGVILPYGSDDFSREKRAVTRSRERQLTPEQALTGSNVYQPTFEEYAEPEADAEVELRRKAAAVAELDDSDNPDVKRGASETLYKELLGFVGGATFPKLPRAQQDAVMARLNEVGAKIGAAVQMPQLHPGLSPQDRARIEQQIIGRRLDEQRLKVSQGQLAVSQGNLGVAQGNLDLARQREGRLANAPNNAQANTLWDRYATTVREYSAASNGRANVAGGLDPQDEDWTRFDPEQAERDLKSGAIAPTYIDPTTKKPVSNPSYVRMKKVVKLYQDFKNASGGIAVAPPKPGAAPPASKAGAKPKKTIKFGGATYSGVDYDELVGLVGASKANTLWHGRVK